jgi:serine/threonine protein kinase
MLQCPRCGRQFPDDVHVCADDFTPLQADPTFADVPVDPLIGRAFNGKYRLDERLGGGGMGTVYRATHLLIERPVAVKVLSQRFVGDETAQQRFQREARAAGRMHHPNAVTVTDFGTTEDGWLYIVMELLEGRTLRDLMAREAPLDPARAVSFMLQTCAAVGAAHDLKLIHRDLKPANIFIEQRPNMPAIVKVLDFGVAKFMVEEHEDEDFNTLTQVGAIIGTPRYMSPEQCSGLGLTPASDVYSLGIILYEMLTGVVPFTAETPLALAMKQLTEAPQPPSEIVPAIPAELERVVFHALAKNPTDRPQDANELRRELRETAEQLGFEHAESLTAPSFDVLREAGKESPSGQLVIDLARLRAVQAAAAQSGAGKPDFHRVDVSLEKKSELSKKRWAPIFAVAAVLLTVIVVLAVLVTHRKQQVVLNDANQVAVAATPSPTVEPSPSPSPSPKAREAKNQRKKPVKKESKIDSIVKKVKGIFKH